MENNEVKLDKQTWLKNHVCVPYHFEDLQKRIEQSIKAKGDKNEVK